MMGWLIALLAGTITGILSAFGIGGGSLLLIYLTSFAAIDQHQAQGINLLYFLPAAAAALPAHHKHGLLDKPEGGKVLLACAKVKDGCVITLEDNGTGIEAGKLHSIKENLLTTKGSRDSEHIGLYNCYNRLKLLFGSNMKFFIESESGKGTAIQIMFHL